MKPLRSLVQLLAALVVLGGVGYVVIDHMVFSEVREASEVLPFDRAEWLAHSDPAEKRNPRWKMVPDLKTVLRGERKSRADIVALLGPPNRERDGSLYYAIGWWGQIDPNSLAIEIKDDGSVGRVRVIQH